MVQKTSIDCQRQLGAGRVRRLVGGPIQRRMRNLFSMAEPSHRYPRRPVIPVVAVGKPPRHLTSQNQSKSSLGGVDSDAILRISGLGNSRNQSVRRKSSVQPQLFTRNIRRVHSSAYFPWSKCFPCGTISAHRLTARPQDSNLGSSTSKVNWQKGIWHDYQQTDRL